MSLLVDAHLLVYAAMATLPEHERGSGCTDLANLLPLCSTHHHLVHEGGWRLELRPNRTIAVTRPDGDVHYEGTSINRRRPPPKAA